ncbi:5-hydroxytryptamine receptor-like [Ptychodera flava]|uniref:5-hydroxytryptamine receptor-like n=1 Tax=Ptychodera flava TaxID=63121 RepID=UPI00396A9D5F
MRISWVHSRQISRQLSNSDDGTNRNSTTRLMTSDWRNMKAARMFLVVCGGFQVTWYPYAVITTINSMRVFHGGATPWTVFSMVWLGASSSILNVLIYSVMNGAFRAMAKQTVIACIRCSSANNNWSRVSPSVYDVESEVGKERIEMRNRSSVRENTDTDTTRVE